MSRSFNTTPYKYRDGNDPKDKYFGGPGAGRPKRGRCKGWCYDRAGKAWKYPCPYRGGQVETNINRRRNEDRRLVQEGLDLWYDRWEVRQGCECCGPELF